MNSIAPNLRKSHFIGATSLYRDSNEFVPYRLIKKALDKKLLVLRDGIHNFLKKRKNAVVLDVGTGGGLLAAWAAECETVSEVIAIEDDPLLLAHTFNALSSHPNRHCISILAVDNLLTYVPSQQCDLILCDVLSTALIEQPQMPLVNHYLQFLSPSGRVLPDGLINTITLLDFDFTFCESLIKMPAIFDAHNVQLKDQTRLTKPAVLNRISFRKTVPDSIFANIHVRVDATGWLRSIQLESQVRVMHKIIEGPNSICHPLIIPLNKGMNVDKGQILNISSKIDHRSVDSRGYATAVGLPRELDINVSLLHH